MSWVLVKMVEWHQVSIFNSSEFTWTGVENVIAEERFNREEETVRVVTGRRWDVTTVTEDIRQTIEEQGTETITQLEVTPIK